MPSAASRLASALPRMGSKSLVSLSCEQISEMAAAQRSTWPVRRSGNGRPKPKAPQSERSAALQRRDVLQVPCPALSTMKQATAAKRRSSSNKVGHRSQWSKVYLVTPSKVYLVTPLKVYLVTPSKVYLVTPLAQRRQSLPLPKTSKPHHPQKKEPLGSLDWCVPRTPYSGEGSEPKRGLTVRYGTQHDAEYTQHATWWGAGWPYPPHQHNRTVRRAPRQLSAGQQNRAVRHAFPNERQSVDPSGPLRTGKASPEPRGQYKAERREWDPLP